MPNDKNVAENEVLLRVEHLCQYFGKEGSETRAVDDVSFQIHKGEVFGLVGESGCGKTTTGRSIIKLYNITSGNIYFKGVRIGAGIRSYNEAIANAKLEYAEKCKSDPAGKAQYREELNRVVAENRAEIRAAKYDQKHCDKEYQENNCAAVRAKYEALLSRATEAEKPALVREYRDALRKAKKPGS